MRTLAIVAMLVLTVGCAAKSAEHEPPILVSRGVDTATLVLPLDEYVLTPAQFQSITQAEQKLTGECVRRFGLSWNPMPGTGQADTKAVNHDAQWGRTDEEHARQHGYQPTPEETAVIARQKQVDQAPATAPPPELAAVLGSPASQMTVVNGRQIPDGGCQGEARRTLREGVPADFDVNYPSRLAYEAESKTWADSRVTAKLDAWRDCMRAAGFGYRTPTDAATDPDWDIAPASGREKAVATADTGCNSKVRLSVTAAAVDTSYHHELIDGNRRPLTVFTQSKETLLRNAATVVR